MNFSRADLIALALLYKIRAFYSSLTLINTEMAFYEIAQ